MKKCSSIVWKFFDRIEENNRCVAVLCKLCDRQYKHFGNTTNCRQHLATKHPLQWELTMNGSLDDSAIRVIEEEQSNNFSISTRKRKYTKDDEKNVDTLESDIDQTNEDDEATYIIQQIHQSTPDEEWLEEEQFSVPHVETYEPTQRMKMIHKKIKREIETPPRTVTKRYNRKPFKREQPEHTKVDDRRDEYSVFGEYVANKLRKFKSPRTSGNIQQLVTTILWQAEYGVYDSADSVKRILLHSVQESQMEQTIHGIRVDILESDIDQTDDDDEATCHMIGQMHQSTTDEEWLEEEQFSAPHVETYEATQCV